MATYSIQKLEAANFEQWSSDMKYILIERNVYGLIDESDVKPKPPVDKPEDPEFMRKLAEYKNRCNLALSLIYLNIGEKFRKIVETYDEPLAAWKALKSHHQPDSRAYHMAVFTELCNARMLPDENMGLFTARVACISEKVQLLDPTFSEKYILYQILRYLPSHFDTIVQTILRWDEAKFK